MSLKVSKRYRNDGEGNPTSPPPPPPVPKTFTQEQLNTFLAEERRKYQKTLSELQGQVSQLQNTSKDKEALETKLAELESQYMTKEQLAAREQQKLKSESEAKQKALETEATSWKQRHHRQLIAQTITQAAATHKALNAEQILDMLSGNAKVVEKDGEFQVVVSFRDTDTKTGSPIILEADVNSALKRMSELPERYGNLFNTATKGGTGTAGGSAARRDLNVDFSKMTDEEYAQWRKENIK